MQCPKCETQWNEKDLKAKIADYDDTLFALSIVCPKCRTIFANIVSVYTFSPTK